MSIMVTPTYYEEALLIAVKAHMGQTDKAGLPYILHPLRLAAKFDRTDYKTVAILHDVLEDTQTTEGELVEVCIPGDVIEAVKLLTFSGHKTDVAYFQYIREVRKNKMAQAVKEADLLDNLDPVRLAKLKNPGIIRVERYIRALRILNFIED